MLKAKVKDVKLTKAGKVPKKRGRPKSKKKLYFGPEVQDAIVRYNTNPDNHALRNKIYGEEIHKAFDKLAENIINTFKFSYFSIVAKNYLILHNNSNYKKLKKQHDISVLDYEKQKYNDDSEYINDLTEEVIRYFDKNIPTIFKKKRDIDIAYSIVEIIKRRDEIENFNKKALYILIREMANVDTSHITSVVNVLKKHYKKLNNQYCTTGTIFINKSGSFF